MKPDAWEAFHLSAEALKAADELLAEFDEVDPSGELFKESRVRSLQMRDQQLTAHNALVEFLTNL